MSLASVLKKKIILGSGSPRRKTLLIELGFEVEVRTKSIDEIFPEDLIAEEVPEYLAKLKSKALLFTLKDEDILITADTVVVNERKILHKPKNRDEAKQMLFDLSGNSHKVITGVCISTPHESISFSDTTIVSFLPLKKEEIEHYISIFKPFDKAGGYGIQEWIGMIGVDKIEGSFYTVMGLPVHLVWGMLKSL